MVPRCGMWMLDANLYHLRHEGCKATNSEQKGAKHFLCFLG